uniref:Uncharacterized protein n=1 Tax=Zea mays TaxID=4577 RepID=B8A3J0_MAIZE|nr:unknown [Zea mays]
MHYTTWKRSRMCKRAPQIFVFWLLGETRDGPLQLIVPIDDGGIGVLPARGLGGQALQPELVANHGVRVVVAVPRPVRRGGVDHPQPPVPEARLPRHRQWRQRVVLVKVECKAFSVAAVAYGDVHGSARVRLVVIDPCEAFVGMNVASEDNVDACLEEQPLHGLPHGLALALMRRVRVVPGRVQQHHEPGRGAAVHGSEVPGQPPVLVRAGVEGGVGAQHDDMHGAPRRAEGVVEVGPYAANGGGEPAGTGRGGASTSWLPCVTIHGRRLACRCTNRPNESHRACCVSAYDRSPGTSSMSWPVLLACASVDAVHSVCPRSPTRASSIGSAAGGVLRLNSFPALPHR